MPRLDYPNPGPAGVQAAIDAIRARKPNLPRAKLITAVGAKLGIGPRRVYQILGPATKKPRVTDIERETILKMLRMGMSRRAVAVACGRTRATVDRIAWTPGKTMI